MTPALAQLPKAYFPFSRSKRGTTPSSLRTSGSLRTARRASTTSSLTLGAPSPKAPSPVTPTQPSTLTTLTYQNDLIGNFWGGRSQGMQAARPPPGSPDGGGAANPRAKHRHASLDTFDLKAPPEPRTLARTLFLYGFLFPLLWLAGMVLVFSPTRYDPDLERAQVSSAEEMQQHKAAHRAAEEKWARRCMCASAVLLGLIVVVVVTIVLAMKGK
ncbi:hypothetical protein BN946_scf184836.g10 [Trametes cinnabarina]|uniref:Transmembrane protein n=1 Tax=Pycnoporus cinnabarinus TaxID=5643 RepID=A0A060S6V3_PYCCI|nr:hypothetical protein BN946_scf184836.g10 [Trametes cinnabarina]